MKPVRSISPTGVRHRQAIAWAVILLVGIGSVQAQGLPGERIVKMDSDPFVVQLRRLNGPEKACLSRVRGERRTVRCQWPNGDSLTISSLPPESTIRTWDIKGSLPEHEVLPVLRAHGEAIGLRIDWDRPQPGSSKSERELEFFDPSPGVNGIARMTYGRHGKVVRASVSLAL